MTNNIRNIRTKHADKRLRSGRNIALLLGISPQYYYNLETGRDGKRLNVDHITKLAEIFGVSVNDLLDTPIEPNDPYSCIIAKAKLNGVTPIILGKLIDIWINGKTTYQ